jgi:hypothetical protein
MRAAVYVCMSPKAVATGPAPARVISDHHPCSLLWLSSHRRAWGHGLTCIFWANQTPNTVAGPAAAEVLEQRRAAVEYGTGNGHTSHHPINIPESEPEHPYGLARLTATQRALVG